MKKLTKFERELNKMIFELAEKYGYTEISITGTLDPKWYDRQIYGRGLSISFYNKREK